MVGQRHGDEMSDGVRHGDILSDGVRHGDILSGGVRHGEVLVCVVTDGDVPLGGVSNSLHESVLLWSTSRVPGSSVG